jgi:hypothetical protein
MSAVVNLLVIIAVGVIIADMIMPSHVGGTTQLFKSTSNIWTTSVNGMLGKTS